MTINVIQRPSAENGSLCNSDAFSSLNLKEPPREGLLAFLTQALSVVDKTLALALRASVPTALPLPPTPLPTLTLPPLSPPPPTTQPPANTIRLLHPTPLPLDHPRFAPVKRERPTYAAAAAAHAPAKAAAAQPSANRGSGNATACLAAAQPNGGNGNGINTAANAPAKPATAQPTSAAANAPAKAAAAQPTSAAANAPAKAAAAQPTSAAANAPAKAAAAQPTSAAANAPAEAAAAQPTSAAANAPAKAAAAQPTSAAANAPAKAAAAQHTSAAANAPAKPPTPPLRVATGSSARACAHSCRDKSKCAHKCCKRSASPLPAAAEEKYPVTATTGGRFNALIPNTDTRTHHTKRTAPAVDDGERISSKPSFRPSTSASASAAASTPKPATTRSQRRENLLFVPLSHDPTLPDSFTGPECVYHPPCDPFGARATVPDRNDDASLDDDYVFDNGNASDDDECL